MLPTRLPQSTRRALARDSRVVTRTLCSCQPRYRTISAVVQTVPSQGCQVFRWRSIYRGRASEERTSFRVGRQRLGEGHQTGWVGPASRSRPSTARLRAKAAKAPSEGSADSRVSSSWGGVTAKLVSAATVVFFFLLVPQIIKNAVNMLNGDVAALNAIAWVGYLTALLGNVMLLSYFLDRKEDGGALVQAVGVITNVFILSQTYLAGFMPGSIFSATTSLLGLTTVLSLLKKRGALETGSGAAVWAVWTDLLGLVGVSSLAQATANTFGGVTSFGPGLGGLSIGATVLILDRTGKLPEGWQGLWKAVPAWSATLLFAFQPIAQLVKNFTAPDSLAGLSQATVVLAMVGNGLMVPRALHTRDAVWLAGSGWASFTGWAQLLSLFLNRAPDGTQYLGLPGIATATLVYLSYNALILRQDMTAKGLPVTPASIPKLLGR